MMYDSTDLIVSYGIYCQQMGIGQASSFGSLFYIILNLSTIDSK